MSFKPNELFARFERGEIDRQELQTYMAVCAREIISEIEEDYQNPAAAWLEGITARRAMQKLVRKHGGRLVREIFVAFSDCEDFPMARYFWNASHPDVPLHCFLRMRREPVLRILKIETRGERILVIMEYGNSDKKSISRSTLALVRNADWQLRVLAVI